MAIELRSVFVCEKCGHAWLPVDRNLEARPQQCPKCRTKEWNGGALNGRNDRAVQDRRDLISDEW